jgi:hypothetical protein
MAFSANQYSIYLHPYKMTVKNLLFLFILPITSLQAMKSNVAVLHFNKTDFYLAMSSKKLETVNDQLAILNTASLNSKDAYIGALMMKKASLINNSKEKINLFKSGRKKLEAQIAKDEDNAEFRFLRLIIQEHAPKIVNYRHNMAVDSQLIIQHFKELSNTLKEVIVDYSKNSKQLRPKDLN